MKNIGIITTASVPWLTGTSINPLSRAIFLNKYGWRATLYLPWLPPRQQKYCFRNQVFRTPEEQRAYIAQWLPAEFRPFLPHLQFYPGWYFRGIKSILPLRSPQYIMELCDVVILEEPEHLFLLFPLSRFKQRFLQVLGIIHTNNDFYVRRYVPNAIGRMFQRYTRFLMQRMCHKIIPLSPVEPELCALPQSIVRNVNGVNPIFFRNSHQVGREKCYFIGKLIPEKGIEDMFQGLRKAGVKTIDLFGEGNIAWVTGLAEQYGVYPQYHGVTTVPWKDVSLYKVFVNCSRSEYVCTTTAEALAMQQWVILPKHESNQFFYQFRNCLRYSNLDEFSSLFEYAQTHEPEYDPKVAELSWDKATDRLLGII